MQLQPQPHATGCIWLREQLQLVATSFSHNQLQTGRKPVWIMNTGKYSTNFHTIYLLSAHCWLVCSVYSAQSNLFPSTHVKLLCITGMYLPCLWQVFIFICLLMWLSRIAATLVTYHTHTLTTTYIHHHHYVCNSQVWAHGEEGARAHRWVCTHTCHIREAQSWRRRHRRRLRLCLHMPTLL